MRTFFILKRTITKIALLKIRYTPVNLTIRFDPSVSVLGIIILGRTFINSTIRCYRIIIFPICITPHIIHIQEGRTRNPKTQSLCFLDKLYILQSIFCRRFQDVLSSPLVNQTCIDGTNLRIDAVTQIPHFQAVLPKMDRR